LRSWIDTYIPRDAEREIFVPCEAVLKQAHFLTAEEAVGVGRIGELLWRRSREDAIRLRPVFCHRVALEALACSTTFFSLLTPNLSRSLTSARLSNYQRKFTPTKSKVFKN
jgi:hypothetical protein